MDFLFLLLNDKFYRVLVVFCWIFLWGDFVSWIRVFKVLVFCFIVVLLLLLLLWVVKLVKVWVVWNKKIICYKINLDNF